MLISNCKRFIFIHISKTAGSSLTKFLTPYSNDADWIKQLNLHPHLDAISLKNRLPAGIFNGFFKFAIVRNPYDRLVSLYHFIVQHPTHFLHEEVKKLADFKSFVIFLEKGGNMTHQKVYLVDSDGRLLVDYLGHFETLDEDVKHICKVLGLDYVPLPHSNKSKHKDFQDYYDSESLALVTKQFKDDIDFFNYSFPVKNSKSFSTAS